MAQSTTALLRRIADEQEAKRQAAWAARASGDHERKLPVWAIDTLLRGGDITANMYDAGKRYRSAIERSQAAGGGGGPKVDGGDGDPHARLWDASVSLQVARTARSFVLRARSPIRTRATVLDRLFGWDGHNAISALPTMAQMRQVNGQRYSADQAVRRMVGVLDLLAIHFCSIDRGYGR